MTEVLGALLRAGNLGIDLAKGRAKAGLRRLVRQAIVGTALALFLVLAFGFGLAAFTVWAAHQIGVIPALGFIGLGFLVIALLVWVVGAMTDKRPPKRPPPRIATAMQEESAASEEPTTGSTVGAMAVVMIVGFLLGRQLFRR